MSDVRQSLALADGGTGIIVWVVLGWIALAARWQQEKRRRALAASRVRTQETTLAATPDSDAESRVPAEIMTALAAKAGAVVDAPAWDMESVAADTIAGSAGNTPPPVEPRRVPREPAPVEIAERRPAAVSGALPSATPAWDDAVRLERAGRLAEARVLYATMAQETGPVASGARLRLDRLFTIEGAGWAPWGVDPFGRPAPVTPSIPIAPFMPLLSGGPPG